MECNNTYLNKLAISVFGGIAIVIIFLYASMSLNMQWTVNPKQYQHYSPQSLISKEVQNELPNSILAGQKQNQPDMLVAKGHINSTRERSRTQKRPQFFSRNREF